MIAELICVGTELLMGQVLNTDAQFMARALVPLGVNVYHQVTVGDNAGRLLDVLETALKRADVAILSGGLGPTGDDLTKETVARCFGRKMVNDEQALFTLHERFDRQNREMTPNNLKQAVFPEGSIILPNPNGTAPGCIVEREDGKAAILLPGPPRELMPMFTQSVMPYLEKRTEQKLFSRELRIFGKGESTVEYELRDLIAAQDNPTIAPYAEMNEVTLRVTARCQDVAEGKAMVQVVIDEIVDRLGDVVYSVDGIKMPAVCIGLLEAQGKTLAVAESCTGGMLTSTLVDVPGCSQVLLEGCVTYSDAAKFRRLGVSGATLRKHGAVSSECVKEMAMGMRRTAGTDYALATTGIAGPGGGTKRKPVGLVYVALATEHGVTVKELRLNGDRGRIRHSALLHALDMLRRELVSV